MNAIRRGDALIARIPADREQEQKGEQMMSEAKKVQTPACPVWTVGMHGEPMREAVKQRSPDVYTSLPLVVVNYVAEVFGRGGWRIRREGTHFVMDTIFKHFVFIPSGDDRRARVLIWPRVRNFSARDYLRSAPESRYELIQRGG